MGGISKSKAHELVALQKEILGQSMAVAGKLEMLQGVIEDTLEPLKEEGISIPFQLEETAKFYKLKVKMDNKISGSIYIPKALDFEPKKLVLVRRDESEYRRGDKTKEPLKLESQGLCGA